MIFRKNKQKKSNQTKKKTRKAQQKKKAPKIPNYKIAHTQKPKKAQTNKKKK